MSSFVDFEISKKHNFFILTFLQKRCFYRIALNKVRDRQYHANRWLGGYYD